jgi:hypothetical protein
MDITTFIVEFTNAVAWPLTVLVIALLLRRPLQNLAPLLRTLRYGDMELHFQQDIAEIARNVDASMTVAAAANATDQSELAALLSLAEKAPQTAVMEAWRRVENAITDVARSVEIDVAPAVWTMPLVLSALLVERAAITEAQYDVIFGLKDLRNRVARTAGTVVSVEEASRYADLAHRVERSLRSLQLHVPAPHEPDSH